MAATQLVLLGVHKFAVARRAIEEGWSSGCGLTLNCPDTTTTKTLITNLATQNGCTVTDLASTSLTLTDAKDKTKE